MICFRFSPSVNTRSTSLSPTKCSYGSLPRSSGVISSQSQSRQQPQHHRPPQRGPMRSRSSDRVIPSRTKTQGNLFFLLKSVLVDRIKKLKNGFVGNFLLIQMSLKTITKNVFLKFKSLKKLFLSKIKNLSIR